MCQNDTKYTYRKNCGRNHERDQQEEIRYGDPFAPYTCSNGPEHLHCVCNNDTLNYISDSLYKHYSSRSIKAYDHTWEKGELCIVCYHADKKWYRGKVMDIINPQTLRVFFVDYGNMEDCQVGAVKKRIILEEIPIQCTKAAIVGVKPFGNVWRENDLDIIHKLLVCQPCKIKIVSRPPEPWAVAIWIIEGSSVYALPWYVKNKTQVRCITEDISIHYANDSTLNDSPKKNVIVNGLQKIQPITFTVTNGISEESSSESTTDSNESLGDAEINGSTDKLTSSMSIDCSEEDLSVTLRDNEDLEPEITILNRTYLSKTSFNDRDDCSLSSSKKSSSKSSAVCSSSSSAKNVKVFFDLKNDVIHHCNGDVDVDMNINEEDNDKILSGNSTIFNEDPNESFEIQSIRSDSLFNDINENNFIGSTPLNTSIQDDSFDDGPEPIDFQKFNIRSFTMGLGQAFAITKMSGYIIKSSNRELNKWINACNMMQEEIQCHAEELPLFKIGSAKFCVALYDDGLWYRARILKSVSSEIKDTILVEFIDFGNRMMIDEETCVRSMKKEWMEIPCMSFHFNLWNVRAVPEYYTQTQSAMNSVLGQTDIYDVIIKKYEPQIELEIYSDKRFKHLVYAPLLENNLLEIIDPEEQ